MRGSVLKIALLLASGWMIAACSVDGEITDGTVKTYDPTMAHLGGFISASSQNMTTASGYKVSASLGTPYADPVENKTNTGYTVYSSVQGNINSETFDVIAR